MYGIQDVIKNGKGIQHSVSEIYDLNKIVFISPKLETSIQIWTILPSLPPSPPLFYLSLVCLSVCLMGSLPLKTDDRK